MSNDTVNLLCGFLLVLLDTPGRIHPGYHIVCHPGQDRVIAVVDLLVNHQTLQFLHRRRHATKALPELHQCQSDVFNVRPQFGRSPAVKGHLLDVIIVHQPLQAGQDEVVVHHLARCDHKEEAIYDRAHPQEKEPPTGGNGQSRQEGTETRAR